MLGKAIDYTLTLWDRLNVYNHHGHLEIDSNWLQNGVRPTAVGKKAWLFMGGEPTSQRAAIIYTMIECAYRWIGRLRQANGSPSDVHPPKSRPPWNNPTISTTPAALKYDASVGISEVR